MPSAPAKSSSKSSSEIDWYYDTLPGPQFARALHDLRRRGPVVPARALGGALPIFYIVGYEALSSPAV